MQVCAASCRWRLQGLPRIDDIAIDVPVLLFTLGISLVAGLLFGIIPVAKYATPHLAGALKEGGRLSSAGRARHRARNTLVVAEIALAVVLLVASGLMIRTFQAMRHVSPGFVEPRRGADITRVDPVIARGGPRSDGAHARADRRPHRADSRRHRRRRRRPPSRWTASTATIRFSWRTSRDRAAAFRRSAASSSSAVTTSETMGNTLVAGRSLRWSDSYERTLVVVVSENFAREFWKEPAAALGRRIRESASGQWRTIVGVVGDVRDDGVAQPAPAIVYWPALLNEFWDEKVSVQRTMSYAIRTRRVGSPTLLKEIQQAVWSVNANLPVASVRTLDEILSRIHGADVVRARDAGHRRRRGAGARRGRYLRGPVVCRDTADARDWHPHGARRRRPRRQQVVPSSWAHPRDHRRGRRRDRGGAAHPRHVDAAVRRQRADPSTYVVVAAGLAATALLATYLPARRASRVDPAVALRWEA